MREHPTVQDALGAAICMTVLVPAAAASEHADGLLFAMSPLARGAWAVALLLPMALRRRSPVLAANLFLLVAGAQMLFGPVLIDADIASLAMLYAVLVYGPRQLGRRYVALATLYVAADAAAESCNSAFGPLLQRDVPDADGSYPCRAVVAEGEPLAECRYPFAVNFAALCAALMVFIIATALIAYWQRARLETLIAQRERNEAIAARDAEEQRIAALAERARIAREMHDVVAHTLSIIIVQADGGRYAGAEDAAVARSTMETIRQASRHALDDMTALLGTVGDPQAAGGQPAEPRSGPGPLHGYDSIGVLLDEARDADGAMALRRKIEGARVPGRLSPQASDAVYHAVQESLSNIRKYAGRHVKATVTERWLPDRLEVDILDDGKGAAANLDGHQPGYGLMGMRERIGQCGGTLHAGPRLAGGFAVQLAVPYDGERALSAPPQPSGSPLPRHEDAPDSPSSPADAHGLRARLRTRRLHRPPDGWIARASRWCATHYVVMDVALAAMLFLMFGDADDFSLTAPYGLASAAMGRTAALAWPAAFFAPFAIRRRFPQLSAALVAAVAVGEMLWCPTIGVFNAFAIMSVYSVAVYGPAHVARWVVPLFTGASALLGVRAAANAAGFTTLAGYWTGAAAQGTAFAGSATPIGVQFAVMSCALCLIAFVRGRWERESGDNALVLRERESALIEAQGKLRTLAANEERARIAGRIQEEVASTLMHVSAQAEHGIAMIDAAAAAGNRPSAEQIRHAFGAISAQSRIALARMRELLGLLRQTGSSDEAHEGRPAAMNLKPAPAMARPSGACEPTQPLQ